MTTDRQTDRLTHRHRSQRSLSTKARKAAHALWPLLTEPYKFLISVSYSEILPADNYFHLLHNLHKRKDFFTHINSLRNTEMCS